MDIYEEVNKEAKKADENPILSMRIFMESVEEAVKAGYEVDTACIYVEYRSGEFNFMHRGQLSSAVGGLTILMETLKGLMHRNLNHESQ